MDEAKIHLSPAEMELMNNAELILTKNAILHKVKGLLEWLQYCLQLEVETKASLRKKDFFQAPPKVSRGENYGGLPYIVLDYPRQFESLDMMAVRSLFWWGNFFSSTLHLAGSYKTKYAPKIEKAYTVLADNGYYIGINEDPWAHHFEEDNYQMIHSMDADEFAACCHQFDHLKIAAKWPLWDIHFATDHFYKSWKLLLKTCMD